MTSQKQIDANRANAQKSTGPKSPATKAKSRLNAIRDNLTGQITTLSDEERPIFEKLKTDHIAALAPANDAEHKLAHAIAWDTWRLDPNLRCHRNEHVLPWPPKRQGSTSPTSSTPPSPTPAPSPHNRSASNC